MKKLIILFTLVALSFSADKWEYLQATYTFVVNDTPNLGTLNLGTGYKSQ